MVKLVDSVRFPDRRPKAINLNPSILAIKALLLSDFNLAAKEHMYMNSTIIPPTNKIVKVKNIQLNFIWANRAPASDALTAKAREAMKGDSSLAK